jgi:hypothetical protein
MAASAFDLSANTFGGYTEDELFEVISNQPDFDCLPLPARWFKKYNIPPREATDFSSFVSSRYTQRCSLAPKDLPALIIKEPIKDLSGNVRFYAAAPLEELPMQVISRPYNITDEERPLVEQFIKELD